MQLKHRTYQLFELPIAIILSLLIIVLPCVFDSNLMEVTQSAKTFFFAYTVMVLLLLVTIKNVITSELLLKIKPLDALLAIYSLYSVLHPWLFGYSISTVDWIETLSLVLFYLIVRQLSAKTIKLVLYGVLISGIVQAVYGNLQLWGIYSSNHSLFNITGGFFNPGPYSGYLSAIMPIAVILYIEHRHIKMAFEKRVTLSFVRDIFLKYIPILAIVSILLVLPATRSRTSWIGVIAGTFVIIWAFRARLRANYLARFSPFQKRAIVVACSLVLAIMVVGLYHFKKESANGRLLIWKVSMNMVAENPIFGHGTSKFAANYMNYQAAYFEPNPERPESMVAGDTSYAFNEFLKLAVEKGVFGLLLALLLLGTIFYTKNKIENKTVSSEFIAAKVGLVSILAFSMFSYPSAILPIKIVFVLLIAIVATNQKQVEILTISKLYGKQKWFNKAIWVTALLACLALGYPSCQKIFQQYQAYKTWNNAYDIYNTEAYPESLEYFELAYPMLETNGVFLVQYGKALEMAGKYENSIALLNEAMPYITNSILYTCLGNNYKELMKTADAEQAYMQAWLMTPARFYPLYLLAKLYNETNQHEKAIAIAKKVLAKEVKIESTAIEEIKEELKIIIEK